MQFRKIISREDWLELWLSKYSSELGKRNLPAKDAKTYYAVVKQYLMAHPGNPREIGINEMKQFLAGRKQDVTLAFLMFYDAVAHSDKHLAALAAGDFKGAHP